jgi:uncharacterized protein YkwD
MNQGDVTVALLLAASFVTCAPRVQLTAPSRPTASVDQEIRTVVDLINRHRRASNCNALEWIGPLADVAKNHSGDMVRRNFFSHTNPDGLSPFQRLERAGIKYSRAAENIAAGQQTGAAVFQSWLSSAGHRRNIEDCKLRQHGIGYTRGRPSLPYGTVTNAWTHVIVTLR